MSDTQAAREAFEVPEDQRQRKHGHAAKGKQTPTYRSWESMRARCSNPLAVNYKRYGGRGISFDPSWDNFEVFLRDMGERPKGKTLDKIDNDGNYEPGNCRWSDATGQARNRRNNVLTFEKAKQIALFRLRGIGWREVCRQLGVCGHSVTDITTGRTWSDAAAAAKREFEAERYTAAAALLRAAGWTVEEPVVIAEEKVSDETLANLLRAAGWTVEEPGSGWQPIATAPRDGTHILIAFGQDGMSSAIYTRNDDDPYPWKFIDTQAQGVPIFNGARDDKYGPSHWKPMPDFPTCNGTGARPEGGE